MKEKFNFFYRLRVRYAEIDGQKMVFNAHYLTYMDVAFTEYIRTLGLDFDQLAENGMPGTALAKTTLDFKSPAFFDEALLVGVRIPKMGNSSYVAEFIILKEETGEVVLQAESVYVNYNPLTRKSEPIPEFFRNRVDEFEAKGRA